MNGLYLLLLNAKEIVLKPGLHRDTIFLATSSILGALGGFIYWKLVTLFYPPAIVGIAAAGISSATYLASFGTLGTTNGMVRFLPTLKEEERSSLITTTLLIAGTTTFIFSLIFLLGKDVWAKGIFPVANPLYIFEFITLAIALTLSNIFVSVLQADRNTHLLPVWNLISYLIQIFCIFFLPRWLNMQAILLAVMIQNVLTMFLLYGWTVRLKSFSNFSFDLRLNAFNEIFRYSLGNQVFGILWGLPAFILPLLVIYFLGADANARFALTWMVYSLIYIIPSSMSIGMLIEGSHTPDEIIKQWREALKFKHFDSFSDSGDYFAFIKLDTEPLGESYESGTLLLRLLTLSTLPLSFNGLFLTYFRIQKMTRTLNLLALLLVFACFTFSALFIWLLGLNGLGWGWLIGQALFGLFTIPYFIKLQRVEKDGMSKYV